MESTNQPIGLRLAMLHKKSPPIQREYKDTQKYAALCCLNKETRETLATIIKTENYATLLKFVFKGHLSRTLLLVRQQDQ